LSNELIILRYESKPCLLYVATPPVRALTDSFYISSPIFSVAKYVSETLKWITDSR